MISKNAYRRGWSPIIIIGMHRSGTTMLTRVLGELGLFVGKHLEENHESIFFMNLNNWLMRQCGAEWDQPDPFHRLAEAPDIRAWMVQRLDCFLRSPRVIFYLGASRYMRWRTPFRLDQPWGWKDPRNTYTLRLWLDLFPQAKVVHIYRHGVDVAQSLKRRAEKLFTASRDKSFCVDWLRVRPREATNTIRCLQLEGGFSLWEEYMAEAQRQVAKLGERALEIRYETLLEDPPPWLGKLTGFCGLSCEKRQMESIAKRLHQGRAYSYRTVPSLAKFAEGVSARLKAWGYSA